MPPPPASFLPPRLEKENKKERKRKPSETRDLLITTPLRLQILLLRKHFGQDEASKVAVLPVATVGGEHVDIGRDGTFALEVETGSIGLEKRG